MRLTGDEGQIESLSTTVITEQLTEHVDNLSPAVVNRAESLVVHPPHSRPPHVAPARPPDHDYHVRVEEDQEGDGQQEEDDE